MISGIGAAIKLGASVESTTRRWFIRQRGQHPYFAATNTAGAGNSISGNTDWQGQCWLYGHTPLVFPGDTFAFIGSVDGTNGVTGNAICERLTITCHGERGGNIEAAVGFAANGALSFGAAAAADTSAQTAITSIGKLLKLDGVNVSQERLWRLSFWARNYAGVHTGVATAGTTERVTGNLFAAWTYQLYVDDPSTDLPAIGDKPLMRFYVTDSTYWELKWGHVQEIDPYGADREGARNVGATVSGIWSSEVGGVDGQVVNPAEVIKWP